LPGQSWHRADQAAPLSDAERAAVDIAIVANPRPGQLTGYPNLRLIQSLWAGVDRLLDDPTLPAEVPLLRMVDPAMSAAMAETALWAVLSLHRGFFTYARQQAERRWVQHDQRRADEVHVLVAGQGELGCTVAARLVGQGYRVSGWSRTGRVPACQPAALPWLQHSGADAWPALAAQADIVVNLLPLTAATRGYFDAGRFAGFKRGAGFVNLARGAAVDDEALLAALDAGHLGHAVLDVFRREPLDPAHRYWHHPAVTVLPHVAALTDARSAAGIAAANVRALQALAPGDRSADQALVAGLRGWVDRQRGY
jgi:glyoxylate/hydroxypyruvate reductase A